jgi:hypothetical protein
MEEFLKIIDHFLDRAEHPADRFALRVLAEKHPESIGQVLQVAVRKYEHSLTVKIDHQRRILKKSQRTRSNRTQAHEIALRTLIAKRDAITDLKEMLTEIY